MKNNKGFTLVEIISVIGILVVIALVAVPSIISISNNNKEKNYQKTVDLIVTSAENYYHNDIDKTKLLDNESCYVTLKDLTISKYLKAPITNPKTNDKLDLMTYVKITKNVDENDIITIDYEYVNDINMEGLNKCYSK